MSKKVVIWGHLLHSHTHSYIHYAFYKAFKYLGYETHWIDSVADIGSLDLTDALFIVEGQVDGNIPILKGAKYLLHNCDSSKYEAAGADFKVLQVYSHDVLSRDVEKINECEYFEPASKTLYQPWATDLLPHEFEEYPVINNFKSQDPVINWVGSVMDGQHGNIKILQEYASVAAVNGITFRICKNADPDEAINLVRESIMAPALQGQWQVENGYVPCRIFKNISYGHLGATNSETVFNLYEGLLTYSANPSQLFLEMKNNVDSFDVKRRDSVLKLTSEKHTYINRVNNILEVMS